MPCLISCVTTAGVIFLNIRCTSSSAAFICIMESSVISIPLYPRIRTARRFSSVASTPRSFKISSTLRNAFWMESPMSVRGAVINVSYCTPAFSSADFICFPCSYAPSIVETSASGIPSTYAGSCPSCATFSVVSAKSATFSGVASAPCASNKFA